MDKKVFLEKLYQLRENIQKVIDYRKEKSSMISIQIVLMQVLLLMLFIYIQVFQMLMMYFMVLLINKDFI